MHDSPRTPNGLEPGVLRRSGWPGILPTHPAGAAGEGGGAGRQGKRRTQSTDLAQRRLRCPPRRAEDRRGIGVPKTPVCARPPAAGGPRSARLRIEAAPTITSRSSARAACDRRAATIRGCRRKAGSPPATRGRTRDALCGPLLVSAGAKMSSARDPFSARSAASEALTQPGARAPRAPTFITVRQTVRRSRPSRRVVTGTEGFAPAPQPAFGRRETRDVS
jgi:hypothetical protein